MTIGIIYLAPAWILSVVGIGGAKTSLHTTSTSSGRVILIHLTRLSRSIKEIYPIRLDNRSLGLVCFD